MAAAAAGFSHRDEVMISAKASSTPDHILVRVDGLELIGAGHSPEATRLIVAKPLRLLLVSLASCTSLTLRALADRNGWHVSAVDVDIELSESGGRTQIQRILSIEGDIDEGQREELLDAAEKTEVTLHLRHGFTIRTELA